MTNFGEFAWDPYVIQNLDDIRRVRRVTEIKPLPLYKVIIEYKNGDTHDVAESPIEEAIDEIYTRMRDYLVKVDRPISGTPILPTDPPSNDSIDACVASIDGMINVLSEMEDVIRDWRKFYDTEIIQENDQPPRGEYGWSKKYCRWHLHKRKEMADGGQDA